MLGGSIISSWVGVPAPSSRTGVPSTPSGLMSPRARLKPGLPCRKLLILDSKLGGETEGTEGRGGAGGGGGGGGDSRLSAWLGVSILKLLPRGGLALGVDGLSRVLTAAVAAAAAAADEDDVEDDDDSGEVLLAGAEEVLVTLCNRDDKPAARHKVKVEKRPSMT